MPVCIQYTTEHIGLAEHVENQCHNTGNLLEFTTYTRPATVKIFLILYVNVIKKKKNTHMLVDLY